MLKQLTMTITLSAVLSTTLSLPVLAHEGEVHCEDTALSGIMKEMNDDLKTYVKAFKRNDQMSMQVQILKLLANTKKAKEEVPLKIQQVKNQQTQQQQVVPEMTHDHSRNHLHDQVNDHAQAHSVAVMDHSNMSNMPGMDHQTHMQHMGYQQGLEKLTHLFQQLQTTKSKTEVKTVLNEIKQHTKKSHQEYQLECE